MKKSKSISFTLEELRKKPCASLNPKLFSENIKKVRPNRNDGKIITRIYPTKSKEKNFIEAFLFSLTNEKGILLYGEYLFHPERKWRFDWCVPGLKIAFEYEGLMSDKSRHTTIKGFSNDSEKYNEAQKMGWKVFRYTALNYRNISDDLKNF